MVVLTVIVKCFHLYIFNEVICVFLYLQCPSLDLVSKIPLKSRGQCCVLISVLDIMGKSSVI